MLTVQCTILKKLTKESNKLLRHFNSSTCLQPQPDLSLKCDKVIDRYLRIAPDEQVKPFQGARTHWAYLDEEESGEAE
jgi:hypothetical protein